MRIFAAKMLSLFCGPNAQVKPPGPRPKASLVGLNRVLERRIADLFSGLQRFLYLLVTLHILNSMPHRYF